MGAAIALIATDFRYGLLGFDWGFARYASVTATFGCSSFVLLSYPLYRARRWARRVLVVIDACITICCLVFAVHQIMAAHGTSNRLISIGIALCFVTPPAFLLCVL